MYLFQIKNSFDNTEKKVLAKNCKEIIDLLTIIDSSIVLEIKNIQFLGRHILDVQDFLHENKSEQPDRNLEF